MRLSGALFAHKRKKGTIIMELTKAKEIFDTLNKVDLTGATETKMNLTYLSWAKAWGILKKYYPEADWTVHTRKETVKTTVESTDSITGAKTTRTTESVLEIPYFTDGHTAWVEVEVVIDGISYLERLPVMNNMNKSIAISSITSVDVNKAIQRAFVKACARHGLGLYIYAGEDLPEDKKIDINKLIAKADAQQYSKVSEESFNNLKIEVIQAIRDGQTSWTNQVQAVLIPYIQKAFNNRKVSETTIDDAIAMQKVYYVLTNLN